MTAQASSASPLDIPVMPLDAINHYGLKIREATAEDDWMAPDDEVTDPKNIFGWPRCLFIAYSPGDSTHATLLCGGGQTEEKALANAIMRIERIGVDELERQRVEKHNAK